MSGRRGPGPTPPGPDGDSRPWRASLGYLAIAMLILAGAVAFWSWSPGPPSAEDQPPRRAEAASSPTSSFAQVAASAAASSSSAAPPTTAASATSVAASIAPQVSRTRDPNGDLTPDLADFVNAGERPTMAEVIDRLHAAGVHGGLGAFSPPGTRPPLVGLAVPEDFVLPKGYVRHYQATDDGQRIEPILMFAPDHRLFDANGRPVALPSNRVVPPELAPPGLPIRPIVIPAPAEPGRPGR